MVVAAVALYFANAGEEEAPALAAYVAARGQARRAADLATAIAHVAEAAPADRAAAFKLARTLVRQSHLREAAALSSVRRLAPRGRASEVVTQALDRDEDALVADLHALERAFSAITGQNLPNVSPGREEQALADAVYVPVTDPGAWQDAVEKVKPLDGVHRMLQFEVMNFADGRRTTLEVYEAVAAEALAAGRWYYGTIKPGEVKELLDRGAKAGAFSLRRK